MTARRSPEDLDLERRLAGALRALKAGPVLGPGEVAAVRAVLLGMPGVVAEERRQEARRQMEDLVAAGHSTRAAAELVASRFGVHADTVRNRWW